MQATERDPTCSLANFSATQEKDNAFAYPIDFFKWSENCRQELHSCRTGLRSSLSQKRAILLEQQRKPAYDRGESCSQQISAAVLYAPRSETMKQWVSRATSSFALTQRTRDNGRPAFEIKQRTWRVECKEEKSKQLDALHAASEARRDMYMALLDSIQGRGRRKISSQDQDRHYP